MSILRIVRSTIRARHARARPQAHRQASPRRVSAARSRRSKRARIGWAHRHWHLRTPGRPGTLELNAWQNRVSMKVHPLRDGGWANALAHELAAQRGG